MEKEFFNFLKNAYTSGLCSEYRDEIRSCHGDKLQLVRLAMRQQSIPYVATKMADGVITKEYAINNFGEYMNGVVLKDCDDVPDYTYSWYMDYPYDNAIVVETDVCHVSHTKDKDIVIQETKCPILYISNHSKVSLVCEGYNSVKVYLFDDSELNVEDTDIDSTITVFKYSDKCSVEEGRFCFAKVKSFNKQLKL